VKTKLLFQGSSLARPKVFEGQILWF